MMIRAFQATEQQMEDAKTYDEESPEEDKEMEFGPTGGDIIVFEGTGIISEGEQKIPVSKGVHIYIAPNSKIKITIKEKLVYRIMR